MVNVHVKYFATLADTTGRLSEAIALQDATLGGLMAELARRYGGEFKLLATPETAKRLSYVIALNGDDVRLGDAFGAPLADGDSVAIIPPVAAGGGLSTDGGTD